MKKFLFLIPFSLFLLSACDLQPKISSFPDNVGDFISARYPTLLADPDTEPEIYNSAASDYGAYQPAEIYGMESADAGDYVQYSDARDYQMPAQPKVKSTQPAVVDDYISVPDKKIDLTEYAVEPKDTLYSISRKYEMPVNDLAVLNRLEAPFALSIGQKLKVPDRQPTADSRQPIVAPAPVYGTPKQPTAVSHQPTVSVPAATPAVQKTEKVSSAPTAKLPAIAARSSSQFSWPVRGTILSGYGAKPDGLFNDGINIGAKQGAPVSAADNGVVAYAGNEVKGMGNLIIVQHASGWMSVYAHLDSMNVRRGHKVNVGQKIGEVGSTGKVDKPQLHFELRKGTKAYDPQKELKK
jgi:murein DD-endopeptidase MepM/ murein hydrolase activator NlpD